MVILVMDSQVPGNGCVGQFLATVGLGTADRGLASGGTQQRGLLPSVPAGDSYLSSYWSELICRLFLLVYCLQFQQVFLNSFPIGLEFICRLFLLARKEVYCLQFQQVILNSFPIGLNLSVASSYWTAIHLSFPPILISCFFVATCV